MAVDPEDLLPAAATVDPEDLAPPLSKAKRTAMESLLRGAGLAARVPAHIATGTAGVLADAATGIYNTGADLHGIGGPRFNKVTPSINTILDKFLPSPETPMEHAMQFGGSLFGGPADAGGRMVQKGIGMASHIPGVPTSKMAQPAWDMPPAQADHRARDAITEASKNVIRNSRYGRFMGDLGDTDPVMLGILGTLLSGGPWGTAAAALPAVARAMSKPPLAKLPDPPLRLPNGRFTTAAKLSKHEPLPEPYLSPLQEQFGIGGMPSLFSVGEQ